jgi:hypothetical protein
MWKGIRHCNLGAIILVAAAIAAGGITDIVPVTTRESIADIFQDVVLLFSACAAIQHRFAKSHRMASSSRARRASGLTAFWASR